MESLIDDLVYQISNYLSYREIINLSHTCSKLRLIFNDEYYWKNRFIKDYGEYYNKNNKYSYKGNYEIVFKLEKTIVLFSKIYYVSIDFDHKFLQIFNTRFEYLTIYRENNIEYTLCISYSSNKRESHKIDSADLYFLLYSSLIYNSKVEFFTRGLYSPMPVKLNNTHQLLLDYIF